MEVRNWKNVLLHWLTECGFVAGNYFSLEQTDIDEFYRNFRSNHKLVQKSEPEGNIISFLKEQYPDYSPLLDDENTLSSTEYLYVYSLLLHFSCVKYPETNFHDICKRLSVNNQRHIAAFFNELIDCQSINRDKLCQAIAGTLLKSTNSSGSGNDSHSSGNNSTGNNLNFPSSSFPRPDSPFRTARYAPGNSSPRIVPPTPKSAMLEERTRELYNLRAQLETERYEKGLLEVQIKQNEEKIKKLNQDHKKLQQTIQALRNDILTQNATESSSPNKDGEQMKRRLCKEVAQKEEEIAKLNEVLGNMKEEKSLVQEKLRFAEKQIVVCMDRITELDFKVDELTTELEQKELTIKCLNENKLELELFINETRSTGNNNSRPDYMDASFSPITDASGSSSSPENLARSVVDVQLREKEHENAELREELHSLKNSNKRISDLIRKFTMKHAQEFSIATGIGSITAKEEENIEITPAECLDHLVDYVDRLGMFYKDEKDKVRTLQADLQAKQRRNDDLSRRLMQFEKEISVLQDQLKNLDHVNVELEKGKKCMQEKIGLCEQDLLKINEQKFELVTKLESLANDYDTHQNICNIQRQDYVAQIKKLESEIAVYEKKSSVTAKENKELNDEATTLQKKIETLQKSIVNNVDEIRTLNERIKGYQGELEAHDKTEKMLKEKYEKILVQHEATKRERRETSDHLEAMRNKIAVKEFEMSKLGDEIMEVRKKNVELESRIDTLTAEFKTEKNNTELAISSRDDRIKKLSEERDKLEECSIRLKSEQNLMQRELTESKEELTVVLKTFNALNLILSTDQADDSVSLAQRLEDVVSNVRRLQEDKLELVNKLELMSFNHTETVSKMEVMEGEMKKLLLAKEELEANYKSLLQQSDLKLKNAEGQLKIYEENIDSLKVALKQVTEDMENALQANTEDHTVRLTELGAEHDRAISSLKEQLNSAEEELSVKERDLQALLEESTDVKKKLDESVQRLEAVQGEQAQMRQASAEQLKKLQEQLENVVSKNKKLLQEIDTFKAEHTKVHEKIEQADSALNELSGQLSQEVSSKTELNVKLQASESRLFETAQKLESIMKEKSQIINGLKAAYESQTAILKRSETQVSALEKLKLKQLQQIATLQQSLQNVVEEKECLAKDIASFTSQIQCEQEEKSALLASFEQTADQLKLAICEKDQQAKILEKTSADLNAQIRDANELCAKLQTDLSAKEAQIQRLQDEQEHERHNWQTKLSEMTRMLAEQSIEQEYVDNTLQAITTIVENHINVPTDGEKQEVVDELIKLPENDKDTQLGKLKYALNRLLHSISLLHIQLDQTEQKRQGAVEVLEKANDKLNTQLLSRNAEITELQQQLVGERKCSAVMEHLKTEVHDLKNAKENLRAEVVRLEHEIAVAKEQHQNAGVELERLQQEKQELKSELQRANENVTRLIQGSDSLRQEKASLVEQLQDLREQLTQTCVQHSSTETMVKNILQNSNTLERKLDSTEKELKLLRAQLQTLESKKEQLAAENAKLRETQEANKKRIEKMAVKLGDTQARCSKSEHDNEKLTESLNASKAVAEKLQREKSTLENDKQLLQERMANTERNQQQLFNKVHQLEQVKASLEAEKKQLEASEADAKAKLTKLEKIRQTNEEKIRKLNYSLETTEASNVRLNHEIGAINSQLNELKHSISADHTAEQLEAAIQERDNALARANELEALANKLQADADHLQEQNSNISDQLSKISCHLQISQDKCDTLAQQLRDLEMDMCALKEEKAQIENEHLNTCAKLKEYEIHNENLRTEREEKIVILEAQLEQLRKELCMKTEEISMLQSERDKLRNGNEIEGEELEQLRKRLSVAEAVAESEQKANTQLRLDNQILQAKYRESKQRLQEETKASEERIKENRLEMEGKLDKMKNKMKTLYTEEVTKMKGKQDRELSTMRAEMDKLNAQNVKYEEHIRKLSDQIMRTNDRILEYQKQNAILSTKLKHSQDTENAHFKRPSLATNSLPRSLSSAQSNAARSSNLAMEDEEGELFNNTYLTDLQTGRMSMCQDVCAEELQYRNSLLPPHLKSTYAAQYDHGLPEDELKDGPNSLDDSMSALLSTTVGGGARKKLTGITNYKRPGPPTPGKHGGRLSLGSSEPPREILKEVYDHGSTAKTPVRFGFFTSKFSMGNSNSRDETLKIPMDLLKAVQQKNFEAMCLKSPENICTSTPRKSTSHFDKRCLFDQLMALSGPSMLSLTVEKCPTANIENTKTPPAILSLADVSAIRDFGASQSHLKMLEQQRVARKRRSSLLRLQIGRRLKHLPAGSPLSSETPSTRTPHTPSKNRKMQQQQQMPLQEGAATSTTGTTTSATSATATTTTTASSGDALRRSSGVGGRHRRRHKRDRGPRLSLYACGSSIRTPNRTKLREQIRKKAHKQRRDNFNRGRGIQMDNQLQGGQGFDSARESEDNNNSHAYRLNATIVLSKKCEHPEEYDIPEYTSNYFSEIITGTSEIIEETSAETKTISGNCHETNISADHAYDSNVTQLPLGEIRTQNDCENSEESDAETTTNSNNESDANDESNSSRLNTSLPVQRSLEHEAVDEPSTVDEIEQFDARCKHFEELAAHTASAAPFTVTNIEFDIVPTPTRHSQRTAEEKRQSVTYTLLPQRGTKFTLAADLEIKATPPPPILVLKKLEVDDKEMQITLADVVRLWSSIWMRMDQQLQLTVILAVFAPIIAVIYLVLSQYA
ncbi:PREDICTED: major antigen isoform X2 [Rhagoletis zephyria]|uniref:major antigen isoform X2 n=1 Tax=Rhagoletis zephyria TaxID=28612 RepID=UPI000811A5C0|nr:PREDICTED: major antigen isoform X2 [Rhagoletis zephyria]